NVLRDTADVLRTGSRAATTEAPINVAVVEACNKYANNA
ncbi:hypothetical protein A2U01_0109967, partial [Trifolium medium]|nr:hypothetical protein [Trifolium medium]